MELWNSCGNYPAKKKKTLKKKAKKTVTEIVVELEGNGRISVNGKSFGIC